MSEDLSIEQKKQIKSVVKKWNPKFAKFNSGLNKTVIGLNGSAAGLALVDIVLFGGSFAAINALQILWTGYFTNIEFSKKEFHNSANQILEARQLYKTSLNEMDKKFNNLIHELHYRESKGYRREEIFNELENISKDSKTLSPMFNIKSDRFSKNEYLFYNELLPAFFKKRNKPVFLDDLLEQESNRKKIKSLNKKGFGI